MFKRALADFEAKPKAQQSQVNLAKQPHPPASQISRHDANIKEQLQEHVASSSGPPRFSQSSKPTVPFLPRSSNTSQPQLDPSQPVSRTVNSKHFASLYNEQNSFKEDTDLIDLIAGNYGVADCAVAPVEIFDGDISDDENLDLDYECPSALPPPRVQAAPANPSVDAPPTDNTSILSWSQSSPSHFQAAQSVSQSTLSRTSTKRSTPDDDTQTVQHRVKRRILPAAYRSKPAPTHDVSTPAVKSQEKAKESRAWDYTPDTIKTQQKNLKNKSKKSAGPGAEAPVEHMQQAVKSYTAKQSAISLSGEQEHVKELVCRLGKSVFFTGPAGTGKSVLMRAIIQDLKKKYAKDPERLAVTASTGLAACNIGGMTLHSFAGIGLGKDDAQTLVKKIRRNPKAKNRWMRTRVLIVDEISMVDGDLFDKLSQIGRIIRNNGRPWGGIQLVITGDFFQLPPVPDRDSRDAKFAFEAATWNTSIDHTIGLTEVFRQKDPGKPQWSPARSCLLTLAQSLLQC